MRETGQGQSQGEHEKPAAVDEAAAESSLSGKRALAWVVATLLGVTGIAPLPAQAVITPPVTIAGPASDIAEFGGVAMAPDGSGGAVFTKFVEGVPHVFASRFVNGAWSSPMRVDGDQPFEASQPAIAAGRGGELLVVWVTPIATVTKKVRYALYSARIGAGASSFQPSLLVDPEVGDGDFAGIDPSVSGTASGIAAVAYRVITYRFEGPNKSSQLRPGDVLDEIRVARLKEGRWSRIGSVNANPELSVRPPSPTNGPQIGAGTDGGAVIAWQESDPAGVARIYLRRIFGTVPGPILQASPGAWEGTAVTGDTDAFSLAVTRFNQARVAMRVLGNGGQGPTRLFLNTLPPDYANPANALSGAQLAFSAAGAEGIGLPGLAAYEKGGTEGLLRLGFVAAGQVHQLSVDGTGKLAPLTLPAAPAPQPGAETAVALTPASGAATLAYPARDSSGRPTVAVRQEFPKGEAQLGLLTAPQSGPISQMRLAGSGEGDALVGFREGEPGSFQVVVARVTAPAVKFKVEGPKGWVRPRRVKLRWERTGASVGGVSYAVLLGGRLAKRGLHRLSFRVPPGLLGNGKLKARVLATDGAGQQVLSGPVKLLVDGEAPLVRVTSSRGARVGVRIGDSGSGPAARRCWVSFGDGSVAKGGSRFHHLYERPGRYAVTVHARDRAGNRVVRRFEVRVR